MYFCIMSSIGTEGIPTRTEQIYFFYKMEFVGEGLDPS